MADPTTSWRGHCIELPDGTRTMPDTPPLVETERYRAVVAVSELVAGAPKGLRVADLACFEGGFALGFAQAGAEVVGIEARDANVAKLRVVEEHFRLPNLEFRQEDVKDFSEASHGRFDLVLALGILYHLDHPVEWLAQIVRATSAVVVDTHVAVADDDPAAAAFAKRLGPLVDIDVDGVTYTGRWFRELDEGQDRNRRVLASWSNRDSFWLTRESLVRAMLAAGCRDVIDYDDEFTLRDWRTQSRVIIGGRG